MKIKNWFHIEQNLIEIFRKCENIYFEISFVSLYCYWYKFEWKWKKKHWIANRSMKYVRNAWWPISRNNNIRMKFYCKSSYFECRLNEMINVYQLIICCWSCISERMHFNIQVISETAPLFYMHVVSFHSIEMIMFAEKIVDCWKIPTKATLPNR